MSRVTFGDRTAEWRESAPAMWLLIAAVAVALAYGPMLCAFFQQQWARPQSQFFPFVIAAVAGMFWMRWKEAPEAPAGRRLRGRLLPMALALLAWTTLLLAAAMYNPWLSAVSFNLLMAAVAVAIGRRRDVAYLWGLWAMLWLMVPLPLGLDQQLISRLQLMSSRLSSLLLDMAGVDHLMSGNLLLLPDRQLFVDEACSGIVSVMSIVACGVIYGVWRNRPPVHIAGLAACGVFWAMIMNVVRISAIALAWQRYGIDWTEGTPHEMLSLAVFLATFGALLSTDRLLAGVLAPAEMAWRLAAADNCYFGRQLVRTWDRAVEWGAPLRLSDGRNGRALEKASVASTEGRQALTGRAFAAEEAARGLKVRGMVRPLLAWTMAFGALGVGQLSLIAWNHAHPTSAAAPVADARRLSDESLPASLAGFQRTGFKPEQRTRDDIFGEYSRTYTYIDQRQRKYLLSCDFPFSQGWHELTVCYRGAGWEIARRETTELAQQRGGERWPITEADLNQPDGTCGYVAWSMFDENGEPVSPPSGALRDQLWRLIMRRSPYVPTRQMFQVQVFISSPGQIADQQREQARRLLLAAREEIRRQIAAGSKRWTRSASWCKLKPILETSLRALDGDDSTRN